MTVIAVCRTCGTEPLENARFCHGCGAPVDDVETRETAYERITAARKQTAQRQRSRDQGYGLEL
jgi:uncharacterized membrane protein YvbJ